MYSYPYHVKNVSYRSYIAAYRNTLDFTPHLCYDIYRREVIGMKVIDVEDLTKKYGDLTAVDHISFSADKGQLIGFLGVNGAGKSTTINMMSTLLTPTSGKIAVCGHDTQKESKTVREKIGIVYQNNVLDDLMTVQENLMTGGVIHGMQKREASEKLSELSSIFSIGELLKKKYRTLSGGQKRRCEIAAALMHTPELLILDEPTTGLDPAARQEVWEMITDLQSKAGMTVFLTTHYMEEAAKADHVIIINKGNIIAEGLPHELKERYTSDKLKLYCDNKQKKALAKMLEDQDISQENYGICVKVHSTKEVMPILARIGTGYDSFEVIQGTLDDVFLDITREAE